MTGVKLVAEMHKLKDALCTTARHNVGFNAMRYPKFEPFYSMFMYMAIPYSHLNKVTEEFETLIKLCAKSSALHTKITDIKIQLHNTIPAALYTSDAIQITDLKKDCDAEYFINLTHNATQVYRDTIADELHVKLTALIGTIIVGPRVELCVAPHVVARIDTPAETTLQKSPHVFVVRLNMELLALTTHNAGTITNLSNFTNVKFYFIKSKNFNVIYLLQKNTIEYLVGDDHKLYVVNDDYELVQGSHNGELQHWI